MKKLKYQRVLLKISGEMLKGKASFGVDPEACLRVALVLKNLLKLNLQVGVVVGGGNFLRGAQLAVLGMERAHADEMGMLATLMNGVALKQACRKQGVEAYLMSALECPKVAESIQREKARLALSQGEVVIFVGGTGSPFFTTDTAAALRAAEIGADVLLKATKVRGIYSQDPKIYPNAYRYPELSYEQLLAEKLLVMDATAVALCRDQKIPIFVFEMQQLFAENLEESLWNNEYGSWVLSVTMRGEKE